METDQKFCAAGDVVKAGIQGFDQMVLRCVLDPVYLTCVSAGDVICHPESTISVCCSFSARIITFEIARPIIQGSSVNSLNIETH